jgi:thiamine-phosphate diphosphorylase
LRAASGSSSFARRTSPTSSASRQQPSKPARRAHEPALSTHAPAEIDAVDPALVDYIGVGPVHETPTKPGRPAVGPELVRYAAAHSPVPFFAIGGLDASNVDEVIAAGAERIVVLRAIAEAPDPERSARELLGLLGDGVDEPSR